ncbi:MAG: putative 4-mercaptohistidine N1-methyltransferase [Chloroflexi bacterium]|nr:putative 4-mercaptohistidine N1-methyltransferase [Chloroflexota bacterium]
MPRSRPTSPDTSNAATAAARETYESLSFLSQYLLFHYGTRAEIAPPKGLGHGLDYMVRVVTETVGRERLPKGARALDVGCAVGRATFELARLGADATGIDLSRTFIRAADTIARRGRVAYNAVEDGEVTTPRIAKAPAGVDRSKVSFEAGNAMDLRADLGTFDVVICANLLDRLPDPAKFLRRTKQLVKPGGLLVLSSPHSWLARYTPRAKWLSGKKVAGKVVRVYDGQRRVLEPEFRPLRHFDIEFLLRDHARHFQWGVALASVWRRR